MFHPDQRYDLHMLQQQDLRLEIARIREAAHVGAVTSQQRSYAGATLKTLAHYLGSWLRLEPISRSGASKG